MQYFVTEMPLFIYKIVYHILACRQY